MLNRLGKGSFADVYRAKCKKTKKEVAIKMVIFEMVFTVCGSVQLQYMYMYVLN